LINSSLFRPPYGRITPAQFKALKSNFKIVMWDVLSQDYDSTKSNAEVIQNVVGNVSKGSIIVLHDNEKTMNRMSFILPELSNLLKNKGWSFKTL
jgi:peptidoglycan-N-acetylglucosamine deacetylase